MQGRTNPSSASALPLGGILDRYIIRSFLRAFFASLAFATVLYFTVDLFDRIDNLLEGGVTLENGIKYFLFKIPLFVSRVFAFATLFSVLFSVSVLARNKEITAMHAAGLSLVRLSLPLICLSLLIGGVTFFWNESLMPVFTRKAEYIYQVEIRKKQPRTLLSNRDFWTRGENSFINADHYDAKKRRLDGLMIFLLDRDFSVRGFIEAPSATWDGAHWVAPKATRWRFLPDGVVEQEEISPVLSLAETPEDFQILERKPEELSFFALRDLIKDLRRKGIDTTEYAVDLQVKLALPLVSPLLAFLAIPFALKQGPRGGVTLSFGVSMIISFGYVMYLAFCISLGHGGALPAWVAAWLPNFTVALLGPFAYLGEE